MGVDDLEPALPALLPEQRVGAAMREARESGGISLRQLAKQLGYHSHTTLSSYERGGVMPTDEAVQGYERILRLVPGTLVDVLESARIERHGDAWAKRRVHIPVEFAPDVPSAPDGHGGPADQHEMRHRGRHWLLLASSVAVLSLAGVIVGLLVRHPVPAHTAFSIVGVRDGSDPTVTGCVHYAVTVDSVRVYDPPEHLIGIFQLRSAQRCDTSWGRFVPISGLAKTPPLHLEIDVFRPADSAVSKFRVTFDGADAYGNMLFSLHQCLFARLTFFRTGQPSL